MKKAFFLMFAGMFILCIPWGSEIPNYGDDTRDNSFSGEIKILKDSLKKIEANFNLEQVIGKTIKKIQPGECNIGMEIEFTDGTKYCFVDNIDGTTMHRRKGEIK